MSFDINKYKTKNAEISVMQFEVKEPKAAILILHGMAEHGARYESFAEFLQGLGFAVWVPDHRQHGKSVTHNEVGIFSKDDTYEDMIADINELYLKMQKKYANLDMFLLGHSMGTMLSRAFVQNYQPKFKKVVLIGSPSANIKGLGAAKFFANIISVFSSGRSNFLGNIAFKGYNSKIENNKTDFDWICSDDEVVQAYIKDEFSGYNYNAHFYYHLTRMTQDLSTVEKMKSFIDVPVLFLYGMEDPVGEYGIGAKALAEKYNSLGKHFIIHGYEDMRHEILNELGKEKVYEDIADFFLGDSISEAK